MALPLEPGEKVGDVSVGTGENTNTLYRWNGSQWVVVQSDIRGPRGPKGPKGDDGIDGPQGPQGPTGGGAFFLSTGTTTQSNFVVFDTDVFNVGGFTKSFGGLIVNLPAGKTYSIDVLVVGSSQVAVGNPATFVVSIRKNNGNDILTDVETIFNSAFSGGTASVTIPWMEIGGGDIGIRFDSFDSSVDLVKATLRIVAVASD